MDKVYLAWFDNGCEWDDHDNHLIGVYTDNRLAAEEAQKYTEEKRVEARGHYARAYWYVKTVAVNQRLG